MQTMLKQGVDDDETSRVSSAADDSEGGNDVQSEAADCKTGNSSSGHTET